MPGELTVLGIRHHGPGSARAVARALDELAPDAVLVEGPPELDAVVALVGAAGMEPPVAGLVYAADEPRRAGFYPMAVFSPEWVALRWALAAGVPAAFADLPAANRFAVEAAAETPPDTDDNGDVVAEPADTDDPDDAPRLAAAVPDPIGALASAAGYDDPERWWEDAVEQRLDDTSARDRFAAVGAAIAEFRSAAPDPDLLTLQREAAMRKRLRKAVADHERVVFVCGAYHVPAVEADAWPTIKHDNGLLSGLPKTKVAATWAPWTSGRLAYASGYGAGVASPGWYHHLFTTPDDVTARWLVRAAKALRADDFDVSPAAVVEATRMADTLATVRGRPLAGLAELNDAVVSVFCAGSELPLRLVGRELIVGHDLGSVPDDTPTVPLAADLAKLQRSLRLKPSAEEKTVVLDLRKDSQLARSHVFHRLRLLGVHWAVPADAGRTTGTFKEAWTLEWRPELAVDLIEASLHGTTVESAAAAKVAADAEATDDLGTLAELVDATLTAALTDALPAVLDVLESRAAHQHDARMLCRAIEPLARTARYGDVRGTDTSAVEQLVHTLGARAAVGLPSACAALDDDSAAACRAAIESAQVGVALLDDDDLRATWDAALERVSTQAGVHGLVAGRVNRLLLDGGRLDHDEGGRRLSRVLSMGAEPARAAAWLDGFLAGDAMLLVHDPAILGIVDDWLAGVSDATFDDLLPLVRRTFSRYEKGERRQIADQLRRGSSAQPGDAGAGDDIDLDRAAPALATVARMLGLAGEEAAS